MERSTGILMLLLRKLESKFAPSFQHNSNHREKGKPLLEKFSNTSNFLDNVVSIPIWIYS